MEQHAEIDVSLKLSSVCIVDASGKIVKETKVASEPEALKAGRDDSNRSKGLCFL
jgi:transposase